MIIFGSTSLNSTIGSGDFFCPRCNLPRQYRHIGVNRFFTLYFIPLIPMGRAGDYVECVQCTGTYGMEILNYNPEAALAQFWIDLRRCLVLLLHEAQRTDSASLARLKAWFEEQAHEPVTPETIHEELQHAAQASANLTNFVHQQFSNLDEDNKLTVLLAGRDLLKQNGPLEERDKAALRKFGAGLRIPTLLIERTFE